MYKETITFTDYDGTVRTEDFYFNLTKQEVFKMDVCEDGGMIKSLEKIIQESSGKRLYERFESIIDSAYGEKSLDGRRFQKSPEILEKFKQTEAYSDLIIHLVSDTDYAVKFINSILPKAENQQAAQIPPTKAV